jgi:hypothetical protein
LSEPLRCENHPNVETYLRCNRCAKPICTRCAVRTPVGYRCKECVRSQQRVFYDEVGPSQYLIAAAVALPLSFVAGWLIPRLGWFAIILGPLAGTAIARAVRWALRRKRGEHTWLVVCGAIALGAVPALFTTVLLPVLSSGGGASVGVDLGRLLAILWFVVYVGTAIGSAYAWLRPGRRS